jgi:hypothetical protein
LNCDAANHAGFLIHRLALGDEQILPTLWFGPQLDGVVVRQESFDRKGITDSLFAIGQLRAEGMSIVVRHCRKRSHRDAI